MVSDLHFLSQFQKVFTEEQAAIRNRCLFDYVTQYELLKNNNYSNNTVKFFYKGSLRNRHNWYAKSVCVSNLVCCLWWCTDSWLSYFRDISTANHCNQILYLKINSKFKEGRLWKDTIIHVSIYNIHNYSTIK